MVKLSRDVDELQQAENEDVQQATPLSLRRSTRTAPPQPVGEQQATDDPSLLAAQESSPPVPHKRFIGIIATAVAGAIASFATYQFVTSSSIAVTAAPVKSSAMVRTVTASGRIVSKKRVDLTTPVAGQITSVAVKERENVRRGQVLAMLDDRGERVQLAQAQAQVLNAQSDVAMTQRTLEHIMARVTSGALSTTVLDDTKVAVEASRASLQLAREELTSAQFALERRTITSPFDGVIMASYAVEGLWAEPPGALFTIIDPRALESEIRVDESDRLEIFPGQTAIVTSDAFPGKEWREEVLRITPVTKSGNANRQVAVALKIGPDAPEFRFGQPIEAVIETAPRTKVLQVPADAIGTTKDGRKLAAIVNQSKVHYVSVETGMISPTTIEVKRGLVEGQNVLPLQRLVDWPAEGAKVSVTHISDDFE